MGPIPDNCNSLVRIDNSLDFFKSNCKWSNESSGRKKIKTEEKNQEAYKKQKLKNPKHIGLVLEKDHLEFIQKQALQRSIQMGRIIQTNELIRDALEVAFPAPKQYDMFGLKKNL